MRFLAAFKNIFFILLIVGVVYLFSNYAEPVKNMVFGMLNIPSGNVLGASSQRASDFSQKVGADFKDQVDNLSRQALNIKLGDIVNTLSRAQKIPQDITVAEDFIKTQFENLTNKNKK